MNKGNIFFDSFNLNNILSTLVLILPLSLIFSLAISNIIVALLSVVFLYLFIFNKDYRDNIHISFFFFISFFILLILSSYLSSNQLFSFKSSIFYFRFYFACLIIYFLILNNKNFLNLFFLSLCFCFGILIFDSFIQYFFGYNIFGYKVISNRITSFFNDELILGSYFSRLSPIFFGLFYYIYYDMKYFRLINFLLILLFLFIIVLSGERVAFVYYIIFLSFYLIIMNSYNLKKFSLFTLPFLIIFIILFLSISNLKTRLIEQTIDQVFFSFDNKNSMNLITNSPFIKHRFNNDEDLSNYMDDILNDCAVLNEKCLFNKENLNKLYKNQNKYLNYYYCIQDEGTNINFKKLCILQLEEFIIERNDKSVSVTNSYVNIEENLNIFIEKSDDYIFISPEHNALYRTAFNMFRYNMLIGVGPRMYRIECQNPNYAYNSISQGYRSCSTSPHNLYLQLLAETGIFGFFFLLTLIIWVIIKFFKNFKNRNYTRKNNFQNIIIICILLNLFPLFPTGNFFGTWLSIIIFLPLTFFLYLEKINVK